MKCTVCGMDVPYLATHMQDMHPTVSEVPSSGWKWVKEHHSFKEGHIFHVGIAFEEWLVERANFWDARHIVIVDKHEDKETNVVLFRTRKA